MKPFRLAVLLSLFVAQTAWAAPQSFFGGGDQQQWGPNGNGTLEHEDDLRWVLFHDAKITTDDAKGLYVADFSPSLRKLDGVSFSVSGYMLPVEASLTSAHFVLTRRSAGCPFCPPNAPTEAIEVFAAKPFAYTQSPITVEGRLHLVARSERGLFYRIDNARVG